MTAQPRPSKLGTALVRQLGRWSDGVRLCLTDGPASGRMMAYACRDVPAGRGPLGRWADRRFLAFPGWDGVRLRRAAVRDLIANAIDALQADGRPAPHLLDLAGGTADALLDAVASRPGVTAACVDRDPLALAAGAARAASLGLAVRYDAGDALDRTALLARQPRPDAVVCTGLYELLADDAAVRRSIATVADLLPIGGRFVVCHQSAVPPVGVVGRWLADASAGGRPVLTPRSRDVLVDWLTAAGFAVDRVVDVGGLYTLALARRA